MLAHRAMSRGVSEGNIGADAILNVWRFLGLVAEGTRRDGSEKEQGWPANIQGVRQIVNEFKIASTLTHSMKYVHTKKRWETEREYVSLVVRTHWRRSLRAYKIPTASRLTTHLSRISFLALPIVRWPFRSYFCLCCPRLRSKLHLSSRNETSSSYICVSIWFAPICCGRSLKICRPARVRNVWASNKLNRAYPWHTLTNTICI